MTEDGVPRIYYGTEQEFSGGNDPANREDPWSSAYATDGSVFRFIARLTRIRRAYPALTKGDQKVVFSTDHTGSEADAGLFAFERGGGDANAGYALVVLNTHPSQASSFSGQLVTSQPAGTTLTDVLHGGDYVVGDGGVLDLDVGPVTGTILVPKEQFVPGL